MNKFCSNCGTALVENACFCSNCGSSLKINNLNNISNISNTNNVGMYYSPDNMNYVNYSQYNQNSKNGLAIASMVLGIISVIWGAFALLALEDLSSLTFIGMSIAEFIGYSIGFTLFSLAPSIIGLTFAVSSKKKCINGFNKSGLILNIIALCINIIVFVNLISLYL